MRKCLQHSFHMILRAFVPLWLVLKRALGSLALALGIGALFCLHAQTVERPPESKDEVKNNRQTSASSKQDDLADDVVRVETNLVTVPVAVMDRQGRFVIDLRREDFHIYEDGIEQQVAFFAPVE